MAGDRWSAPRWLCRLAEGPMRRRTLQSTLDQRARALIGRERERAALLDLVEREMPLVMFVHGIAGVGKSMLLQAAAVDARARGALVVALDGRTFEPTERGFLTSLGSGLGAPLATVPDATGALAADARRSPANGSTSMHEPPSVRAARACRAAPTGSPRS